MARVIQITGMLDPHTHLRDLQWAHKATFASETKAAVAGGYTTIFDMPNTPPETTELSALHIKQAALARQAMCDYGIWFGAAQGNHTSNYAQIADTTCGLKIFCNATTGSLLIAEQSEQERHVAAWPDKRIIAVHAEGDTVNDILALVRMYRKRVHFLHISTQREIETLRSAKEEGLPVTVGVCPHHLYLNEADAAYLGAYGLMKPTLKTSADVAALWQGIRDGVVDIIESDHAPHTIAEKESAQPPYGVPGLETTLPLMMTAVREGRLSLKQAVALISDNPRRIWRIATPTATYTQVDLDGGYTIDRSRLFTQCGWSPFEGMHVYGRVLETWIRGVKVFDGEQVIASAGFGENVFEERHSVKKPTTADAAHQ